MCRCPRCFRRSRYSSGAFGWAAVWPITPLSCCPSCPSGESCRHAGPIPTHVFVNSAAAAHHLCLSSMTPALNPPTGTYNDRLQGDRTTPCSKCPLGLSTSQEGSLSVSDCDVCSPGFGGPSCALQCGGTQGGPNYGPPGRYKGSSSSDCEPCPVVQTGFSFDHLAVNQNFSTTVVARARASSPADCLLEFGQLADVAWFMGGAAALTRVTTAGTFAACVADCKADRACEYLTFDYNAPVASARCYKKVNTAAAGIVNATR